MSSPHVAGAGALLMQQHPDWTPAEIQSALMLTATTAVLKEDGASPADPFDMGSGRIQARAANAAGLVLDETIANYMAADPATGGDPKHAQPREHGAEPVRARMCVGPGRSQRRRRARGQRRSADGGVVLTIYAGCVHARAGESQASTSWPTSWPPTGVWNFGEVVLADRWRDNRVIFRWRTCRWRSRRNRRSAGTRRDRHPTQCRIVPRRRSDVNRDHRAHRMSRRHGHRYPGR